MTISGERNRTCRFRKSVLLSFPGLSLWGIDRSRRPILLDGYGLVASRLGRGREGKHHAQRRCSDVPRCGWGNSAARQSSALVIRRFWTPYSRHVMCWLRLPEMVKAALKPLSWPLKPPNEPLLKLPRCNRKVSRASWLQERSKGLPDPGASLCAKLLRSIGNRLADADSS